jgi:hypothetical protein
MVCAHKGTNGCKDILKGVCESKGINLAKVVLDIGINNELMGKEIIKPAFKKWHDTTHEEYPDVPIRSPEADTRTLTSGIGIEAIIDEVLQVFHHLDLSHELVLVTAHACKAMDVPILVNFSSVLL